MAWNKFAVRAILTNPRYTGRQVWNRQRKDEVLIDVADVALGHTTKMRWNDAGKWIYSEQLVHPQVIDAETFEQTQQLIESRRHVTGPRERLRTSHVYVLRGRIVCGICDRKMQGHWSNEMAYYRCRFPAEYALANKISHPLNIFVRERDVLPELDDWLAREFRPHRIEAAVQAMAEADRDPDAERAVTMARQTIAGCDAKMARYRAAIDAGGDVQEITHWINSAKAERLQAEAVLRATSTAPRRMTAEEIKTIVQEVGSLAEVIRDADPADKAEIYKGLNLTLTYQPTSGTVRAKAQISPADHGVMVGVRGGT